MVKSINGFLKEICSIDIITRLSFGSTTSSFIRLLEEQEIYREFIIYLKSNSDAISEVCEFARNIIIQAEKGSLVKFADYIVSEIICILRDFKSYEIDGLIDELCETDLSSFVWSHLLAGQFRLKRHDEYLLASYNISETAHTNTPNMNATVIGTGTTNGGQYGQA